MIETGSIAQIFNRIIDAFAFLETSEKKAVVRALRLIYFYPDELLGLLNELIETNAKDPESAIAKGMKLLPDRSGVEEALAFITSESVATNLKLSIEMVEELRLIADYKVGVRAKLHGIYFSWVFMQDKDELLNAAKSARDNIAILNSKIRALEKVMEESRKRTG